MDYDNIKLDNSPEEWELIKEKFRELYLLTKSPNWTVEKQLKLNEEIDSLVKFKY